MDGLQSKSNDGEMMENPWHPLRCILEPHFPGEDAAPGGGGAAHAGSSIDESRAIKADPG